MSDASTFFDVSSLSLTRAGEELCGDQVKVLRTPNRTIAVLSDGLGNGVKANILARLTTEIIVSMIRAEAPLEEVVETVLGTLPVCKVRHIAYATFLVVEIQNRSGTFRVVNFDTPSPFLLRNGRLHSLPTRTEAVHGKQLRLSESVLERGDFLGLMTDGILYAGMGELYNFGWGREQIGAHLEQTLRWHAWSAEGVVHSVLTKTRDYYQGKAGDDATFVGILARRAQRLMLFTGPPLDRASDETCVDRLLTFAGRKVVCGGTTANIVGEHLGEMVETDLSTVREDVPPIGSLSDVDLVTEGILTLAATLRLLRDCHGSVQRLPVDRNGAVLLARELLRADSIFILAGEQVNSYYQNPLLPKSVSIRRSVVDQIVEVLKACNKEVTVEWC